MHTCQIMLVEAEDAEDAIGIVRGAITHAEKNYVYQEYFDAETLLDMLDK